MDDELRFHHQAIDNPGSITCSHCDGVVPLPKTEPLLIVGGASLPPPVLESLRCPHCRTRHYLLPVTDAQRQRDRELDARDDLEDT